MKIELNSIEFAAIMSLLLDRVHSASKNEDVIVEWHEITTGRTVTVEDLFQKFSIYREEQE